MNIKTKEYLIEKLKLYKTYTILSHLTKDNMHELITIFPDGSEIKSDKQSNLSFTGRKFKKIIKYKKFPAGIYSCKEYDQKIKEVIGNKNWWSTSDNPGFISIWKEVRV